MRKVADLVFGLVILVIIALMVWEARGWSQDVRLFPWTIGIPAMLLAIFQVFMLVRNLVRKEPAPVVAIAAAEPPAATPTGAPASELSVVASAVENAFGEGSNAAEEDDIPAAVVRRRTIEMSGWILLFALGILVLGFKLGAGLLTLGFLRFARERWRTSISIAIGTYLFFYLIFDLGLNIPFPAGWIADALNLTSLDSIVTDPIERLLLRR